MGINHATGFARDVHDQVLTFTATRPATVTLYLHIATPTFFLQWLSVYHQVVGSSTVAR